MKAYAVLLAILFLGFAVSQYACACPSMVGQPKIAATQEKHEHSCCESESVDESSASVWDLNNDCCCGAKVQAADFLETQPVPGIVPVELVAQGQHRLANNLLVSVPGGLTIDRPRGPPDRSSKEPIYILWRSLLI